MHLQNASSSSLDRDVTPLALSLSLAQEPRITITAKTLALFAKANDSPPTRSLGDLGTDGFIKMMDNLVC